MGGVSNPDRGDQPIGVGNPSHRIGVGCRREIMGLRKLKMVDIEQFGTDINVGTKTRARVELTISELHHSV